jgi:WD40 repeat protein
MLLGMVFVLARLWPALAQDGDTPPTITAEDAPNLGIRTLLVQHTADVIEMSFTPHGTAFTTGGLDGQFCVWNADENRALPGTLFFCDQDYIAGVTAHAWSPDEKRLAATSANGTTIKLHRVYATISPEDWDDNNYLVIEHPVDAPILSMVFVEGALLVYDVNDLLTLYDWRTGDAITTFDAIDAIPHPDGQRFAIITPDDEVLLVAGSSGEVIQQYPVKDVEQVIFSGNGQRMLTYGNTLDLFDAVSNATQPLNQSRIVNVEAEQVFFTPDDAFVATILRNQVTLWNSRTGVRVSTLVVEGTATFEGTPGLAEVQFTPDMTRSIVLNTAGIGRIYDVGPDGSFDERLLFRDRIDRVFIAPDNVTAIVSRIEFFARLYNLERGQLRGRYGIPPDSEISPDWRLVATRTNNIVAWHTLNQLETVFAFQPIAETQAALNVRQTPSTELARIAVINSFTPVFALGRTEEADWLYVVLPDGTLGWTFINTALDFNTDAEGLPVVTP